MDNVLNKHFKIKCNATYSNNMIALKTGDFRSLAVPVDIYDVVGWRAGEATVTGHAISKIKTYIDNLIYTGKIKGRPLKSLVLILKSTPEINRNSHDFANLIDEIMTGDEVNELSRFGQKFAKENETALAAFIRHIG